MPTVFDKLNLRDTREILVINAPASFEHELAELDGVTVLRDLTAAKTVRFALVFATTQADVDRLSRSLARKAHGDALLWFAYPKGTSKTLTCEFNRDSGWNVIRSVGFDTVRQVAIDQDWSALRFRRLEFIKPSAADAPGASGPAFRAPRRVVADASGNRVKDVRRTRSTANAIDAYIAAFPPETQRVLKQLRAVIKAAASGATETISYAMPTFDLNGRHLVHFAGYRNHVGFYPVPSGIEAFKEELAPYKSGRGSAQFPLGQPLPTDLIRRIVAFRVAESTTTASMPRRRR